MVIVEVRATNFVSIVTSRITGQVLHWKEWRCNLCGWSTPVPLTDRSLREMEAHVATHDWVTILVG